MVFYGIPGDCEINRGLVGYWKLDDKKAGTGVTKAIDRANFNDGTISGAVNATGFNGLNADAMSFDGVDDYVDTALTDNSVFQNGFTISAWIFAEGIGETEGRILDKSTGLVGENGFRFFMGNVAMLNKIRFNIDGGTSATSNADITFNVWNYVLITVSSSQLSNIYVNGSLSGAANQDLVQPTSAITTSNAARIGNRAAATDRTFDGSIANVRIYNRVLSKGEISKLYRNKL